MNGAHDCGGMHGFGPIPREPDEPVFHERWEGRVFGLVASLAARGLWGVDAFRHSIERLRPADYLRFPYYQRWLHAMERLLIELGRLAPGELEARLRGAAPDAIATPAPPPAPEGGLDFPSFLREVDRPRRFQLGDRVRARNLHPPGHTRLPRYVRGRCGTVVRTYPACIFPDSNAHGRGESPQYVYAVRFEGSELWGPHAEAETAIHVDLFEPYLEPASPPRRSVP